MSNIKEFTQFDGEEPKVKLTLQDEREQWPLCFAKDDEGNLWMGDQFNGFTKWYLQKK